MAEEKASASQSSTFDGLFDLYSTFGEKDQKGGTITLKNIDKWIQQSALAKKFTTTDTAIAFSKIAKNEKRMNMKSFQDFLSTLCESKKMDVNDVKEKLVSAGSPGLAHVTETVKGAAAGAVSRLTDVSGYTGSHKERFDESGKGKGLEGRTDATTSDGYVQGYKEKDTYDKTHN